MTQMNGIHAKQLDQINTREGQALCATSAPGWFIRPNSPLGEAFSPQRAGNAVKFFTTGTDYFKDIAQAIKNAKKSIFITGWQVNYEVRLDGETRLWDCLYHATRKADAPDIYLMPWLSPKAAVDTGDLETMLAAFVLNAGLKQRKVWCFPAIQQSDMGNLGTFFSHHQKMVVIDNEIAYVGGIDLAYGRDDDNNFRLAAGKRTAQELYNPCIPPLFEIEGHKQYPYMTTAELIGAALMEGDGISKVQRKIAWAKDNKMFNAMRSSGKEFGEWLDKKGDSVLRFFGAGAADTVGGVIQIAEFVHNQLTPENIEAWKRTLRQWKTSFDALLQELNVGLNTAETRLDAETTTFEHTQHGLATLRREAQAINAAISGWLLQAEQHKALTPQDAQKLKAQASNIQERIERWVTQAEQQIPRAKVASAKFKAHLARLKSHLEIWKNQVASKFDQLSTELLAWSEQVRKSGQALSKELITRGTELVNLWVEQTGVGAFYAWLNNTPTSIISAKAIEEFDTISTPFALYLHSALDRLAEAQKAQPYSYLANPNTRLLPKGGMMLDSKTQPRMPWHDVHMRLEGASVYDLSRNFISRWNSLQARFDGKKQYMPPLLVGVLTFFDDNLEPIPFKAHYIPQPQKVPNKGAITAQVLRSAPLKLLHEEHKGAQRSGSASLPAAQSRQANCLQATLQAISSAQHFIYIENQFFQSVYGKSIPEELNATPGPMTSLMNVKGLPGYDRYAARLRLDKLEENPTNLHKIDYHELADMIRTREAETFTNGLLQVLSNQSAMEALRAMQEPQAHLLNPLNEALAERIERAIEMGENFHVYMVLPVHPEGPLNAINLMTQVHLTMQSLSLGEHSLIKRIQRAMAIKGYMDRGQTEEQANRQIELKDKDGVFLYEEEQWQQYLTLLNLRTWEMLGGRPITEQIYVHSKLLIADDRVAIIGSANINDRSQLGDRDSELAVVLSGGAAVTTQIDGRCAYPVCQPVQQLRVALWRKLFALEASDPGIMVAPASHLASTLMQPAAPSTWQAIQTQANENAKAYEEVFPHIPRNDASIWPTWPQMSTARATPNLPAEQVDVFMPFEQGFWKHPRHSQRPTEIKGFITALPVNWTRQEYNDSTFNLTVLAQIEPRPSAGTSATALASHFPTAPDNEAT
ncbi:Phospholipase D Active site motif-containing protein [Pseudomonas sp. 8AS]|uniref:hypothetical protein n=1 Tax=Pseudomonas sp. 8AS TaxID=2653163 RepID=UPI0012F36D40|nr:hypothetical protein [Pseudomonas sp. 8AS]VXB03598.1 Phospholipase D Active site motif-containing protein [Pseudomonas sp. 8AS]